MKSIVARVVLRVCGFENSLCSLLVVAICSWMLRSTRCTNCRRSSNSLFWWSAVQCRLGVLLLCSRWSAIHHLRLTHSTLPAHLFTVSTFALLKAYSNLGAAGCGSRWRCLMCTSHTACVRVAGADQISSLAHPVNTVAAERWCLDTLFVRLPLLAVYTWLGLTSTRRHLKHSVIQASTTKHKDILNHWLVHVSRRHRLSATLPGSLPPRSHLLLVFFVLPAEVLSNALGSH